MLALGSVKTIITENVKNGRVQFDMHGFLANVILSDLNLASKYRNTSQSVNTVCTCLCRAENCRKTNTLLLNCPSGASPFLLGRALWAASRFTAAMSPELIQQFLQATVSGLHDSQPPSVRISAVRAIWG